MIGWDFNKYEETAIHGRNHRKNINFDADCFLGYNIAQKGEIIYA